MTEQGPANATPNDPRNRPNQAAAPGSAKWLRLLVFLNAGMLLCIVAFVLRGALWSPRPAAPAADAEQIEATAELLEKRGLDAPAAAAWQRYLDAVPDDPKRAEILYHVGELQMRAEQFEPAAAAFVRAELAAGENKELAAKVGPRLIECLRGMGRFGEVGRELARVESRGKKSDDGEVVATIGPIKITDSNLDRMIEQNVDQMLAAQGVSGDRVRRRMALQQASSPSVRARLLHELVRKELFLRRARELKLDQDEAFLSAREQATEALLLRALQNRELKLSPPTDADLQAFYKEHQADYRQPESLEVLAIRVADPKAASALLEKIKSADGFRKQAQQIRQSGSPHGEMTFRRTLFRGQTDSVLGNPDALLALSEGQWTKQPITRNGNTLLALVETKTAARTPSFAEVKHYVQGQYVQHKKREAMDRLFHDLAARYDVHIKLAASPEQLPELSQAGSMLAEPGSAAKPGTPSAKSGSAAEPGTPSAKPGEASPKPKPKPDNPLRSPDTPQGPSLRKEKPAAEAPAPAKATVKPAAGPTAPEAPPGPDRGNQRNKKRS